MASLGMVGAVRGVDEVCRNLDLYGEKAIQATERGLYEEAEIVMAASKRLVPVDTGTLRSTGHVRRPISGAHGISVTMGYGGPAAPYALVQHEEHHEKKKYLETPFLAAMRGISARLAKRIKRNVR
jgi:hypothetical protein